jgi:hypothetical protein
MTLLVIELTGDNTTAAEASFTLSDRLEFGSATLRAIELHAPGSELVQDWNKVQTGDNAGGTRAVYSPLYIDLDGLADDGAMLFQTRADDGFQPKTLIPLGDASASGLRTVNLPISSGAVTLEAGALVTARLYYRRVEDGVLGDIVPIPGNVVTVDEEGTSTETHIGGWSKDARLTLYIDLQ